MPALCGLQQPYQCQDLGGPALYQLLLRLRETQGLQLEAPQACARQPFCSDAATAGSALHQLGKGHCFSWELEGMHRGVYVLHSYIYI